jgi:hypothetical protein
MAGCSDRTKGREALKFLIHVVEDAHQPMHDTHRTGLILRSAVLEM